MKQNPIPLSIIIVNWKSGEMVLDCLASIKAYAHAYQYETIVVDNHSLTPLLETRISGYAHTRVVKNQENLGFPKAVNQGVKAAEGRLCLVLNPDCTLTKTSLDPMINAMEERPAVGIVGPRIRRPDGTIVRACKRKHPGLYSVFAEYTLLSPLISYLQKRLGINRWREAYDQSGPIECLQGSCFLIKKHEFLSFGGFDERIPLFLDDMDLCARYEKEKIEIYYCADSEVIHKGGQSIKRLKNPTDSSLIGFMAYDLYFLKHGTILSVLSHHLILLMLSVWFLFIHVVLFFPLWLFLKKRAIQYLDKHIWMLIYSLTFCFFPKTLPKTWPRCFFKL